MKKLYFKCLSIRINTDRLNTLLKMLLHMSLLSCVITLSVTYSWYSLTGFRLFFDNRNQKEEKMKMRPRHVSTYMWDIYNRGINSSEFDVVKGLYPKISGFSLNSHFYRNHRRRQLEFHIPVSQQGEQLVQAEVRITSEGSKSLETSFQIYLKEDKWLFLGEKKVSDVDMTYISFQVTPVSRIGPGVVTFLVLSLCRRFDNRRERDFSRPALLLSYLSNRTSEGNQRRKRSLQSEDYEEETNRIWDEEVSSRGTSVLAKSVKTGCRRKPLYIKFSEIAFDSWVVAPNGYEAFQCVGKCSFPVSEELSPTKHAILQTLVHNMYPWKASRACCVPTRLEPISLLYVDDNGVLTYRFRYHDMVVAECGCR